MSRELIEKIVVTLVLVAWYFLMPQKGYTADTEDPAHITYILCHANIWHLAGNVFVLWMMKGRLHIASSITIAILCSYIPVIGTIWDSFVFDGETMGFSGVIFAIAGIQWGWYIFDSYGEKRKKAEKTFLTKVLPFAFVGILIPHINWCIHLYCMMSGFIYGRCRR